MPRSRCRLAVAVLFCSFCLLRLPPRVLAEADKPRPPVRLAVLVVFDQLRGDYLQRWDELYVADGFHRLEREGVWFQNCHYPYALTLTGPGHASLATGASPSKHGIIANEWFKRPDGEVYCTGHLRYERVPRAPKKEPAETDPKEAKTETPRGQGTPERLLAPTLADALKDATDGRAKVVSLSMKDRSAVLPGGRRPDACYWFDTADGKFVTSTYYRDAVHSWVADYNATRPADPWFGKQWTRLRPDLDYEKYSGPDDVVGEDIGYLQGRTFPHAFGVGLLRPGKMFYDAVYTSPFGNEILLGLVKRAIDAEKLGVHDVPDLLCISFSCNDPVGHVWGPDSQEVLDVTLRSDLIVKELLQYLDAKVGKGKYVLALSADHGVSPLPEVAAKQGKNAKRVIASDETRDITEFLETTFPKESNVKPIKKLLNESVYLNPEWVKAQGLEPAKVEEVLAEWLKKRPAYETVYTRSQLLKGVADDDKIGQMVRRSFHPDRSGDVMMVLKPYHIVWYRLKGTGHGTPYEYDTHVPLLVYGPGLIPGARKDPVTPQAAATILAQALGIKPPAMAEAPVPARVFAAP
jgi:predicted AlkP superfamily pyrophosphatase or phosphodiesterase